MPGLAGAPGAGVPHQQDLGQVLSSRAHPFSWPQRPGAVWSPSRSDTAQRPCTLQEAGEGSFCSSPGTHPTPPRANPSPPCVCCPCFPKKVKSVPWAQHVTVTRWLMFRATCQREEPNPSQGSARPAQGRHGDPAEQPPGQVSVLLIKNDILPSGLPGPCPLMMLIGTIFGFQAMTSSSVQ